MLLLQDAFKFVPMPAAISAGVIPFYKDLRPFIIGKSGWQKFYACAPGLFVHTVLLRVCLLIFLFDFFEYVWVRFFILLRFFNTFFRGTISLPRRASFIWIIEYVLLISFLDLFRVALTPSTVFCIYIFSIILLPLSVFFCFSFSIIFSPLFILARNRFTVYGGVFKRLLSKASFTSAFEAVFPAFLHAKIFSGCRQVLITFWTSFGGNIEHARISFRVREPADVTASWLAFALIITQKGGNNGR